MLLETDYNFSRVANDWLESKIPQLKPASISKYQNILEWYLFPSFASLDIRTLTRNDVMELIRSLLLNGGIKSKGLSAKTVNGTISVLKSIFNYASFEKGIPMVNINDLSVKQPQKPMRILSIKEQKQLNKYLFNNLNPCNLGVLLSLYTGLRIGEVCALKWKDISFNEQYIYVHQSMQRIQKHSSKNKKTQVIIQTPKSDCSIRKIPIPTDLFRLMLLYKKNDDSFLLTGEPNRYIEPRCMENRFKIIAEKCNILNIKFHSLRHTFATRCIELGFDPKSLSEILGHSSVNITLNRYVHPSMELKMKNMNMLSSIISINNRI